MEKKIRIIYIILMLFLISTNLCLGAEPNPISISTAFYPTYHKVYVTIFSPTVFTNKEGIIQIKTSEGSILARKAFYQKEFNQQSQSLTGLVKNYVSETPLLFEKNAS